MKNYILKLADDSLIMGQRLAEWCGKGPYLEEDIAIINIALDQLGQANNFYNLAANLFNDGRTADDFAMLRVEKEYLNAQIGRITKWRLCQYHYEGLFLCGLPKFIVRKFKQFCR